jgi:hypothetical protein
MIIPCRHPFFCLILDNSGKSESHKISAMSIWTAGRRQKEFLINCVRAQNLNSFGSKGGGSKNDKSRMLETPESNCEG